jgi:hypothetical protein
MTVPQCPRIDYFFESTLYSDFAWAGSIMGCFT